MSSIRVIDRKPVRRKFVRDLFDAAYLPTRIADCVNEILTSRQYPDPRSQQIKVTYSIKTDYFSLKQYVYNPIALFMSWELVPRMKVLNGNANPSIVMAKSGLAPCPIYGVWG